MTLRTKTLGVLAAGLLAAAAAAVAQPPHGQRGMHRPGREGAERLLEFLELTDEQREAWRAAHRAHLESLRPTFEKMRELREQLRAELDGDSPAAATVGGYVIAIHDLESELEAARGELETAILGILDDEQEQKYEAWKAANPRPRFGPGPGGPWGGPPPGGPESGS